MLVNAIQIVDDDEWVRILTAYTFWADTTETTNYMAIEELQSLDLTF